MVGILVHARRPEHHLRKERHEERRPTGDRPPEEPRRDRVDHQHGEGTDRAVEELNEELVAAKDVVERPNDVDETVAAQRLGQAGPGRLPPPVPREGVAPGVVGPRVAPERGREGRVGGEHVEEDGQRGTQEQRGQVDPGEECAFPEGWLEPTRATRMALRTPKSRTAATPSSRSVTPPLPRGRGGHRGPRLPLASALGEAHPHEDEEEHRDLGPLAVGGAHVALHEGVGGGQADRKDQDGQDGPQLPLHGEGEPSDEGGHQRVPHQRLRHREGLTQPRDRPRERRKEKVDETGGQGAQGSGWAWRRRIPGRTPTVPTSPGPRGSSGAVRASCRWSAARGFPAGPRC